MRSTFIRSCAADQAGTQDRVDAVEGLRYFQQGFQVQGKWRVLQKHAGIAEQADIRTRNLVLVPFGAAAGGNVFRDDQGGAFQLAQDRADLLIAQVLKHLPDQIEIPLGQRVVDDVQTLELNHGPGSGRAQMRDEGTRDIHAGVADPQSGDDPAADTEITAAQVDHAVRAAFKDVFPDGVDVGLRRARIAAGAGVEGPGSLLPPQLLFVYMSSKIF